MSAQINLLNPFDALHDRLYWFNEAARVRL